MASKEGIIARLQKMEVMEGVMPTAATRSPLLGEAAELLRRNEVAAAMSRSAAHLQRVQPKFGLESAIELLSGSQILREQVAGFAQAGIDLFLAKPELLALPLAARAAQGANGIVSRVLLSEQRILLETPRVVVRFNKEIEKSRRESILKKYDVIAIGEDGLPPDTVRGSVQRGDAVTRSLELMHESAIVYAEPDFIEHVGQRLTPTDPDFAKQWHHKNIQAEKAWDSAVGKNVRIAVVDNGFDITHPDLAFGSLTGRFHQTPDGADADFVPGTTGIDTDDHGTACAGMIAAVANNAVGGCGVAYSAELSMVACLGDQVGTQSTLARAIAYAARPSLEAAAPAGSVGCDIIACSLGPNTASWQIRQVLSDAIDFAATQGRDGKGCAIFWACTNGNFPIGSDEVCSHAHVLAVGRSRQDDLHDGSGFGPQLEFLAPGVDVWIPAEGGGYQTTTGTSFAAPCAAGVAALALAAHPEATAQDLRDILRRTCDKTGPLPYINGRNIRFGFGRVNANKAVAEAQRLAATT